MRPHSRHGQESRIRTNPRPSFGLIVHHTDSEREYAYDSETKSTGRLVEAPKEAPSRGWLVVDMKQDWNATFRTE